MRTEAEASFPNSVRFTSLYSRGDGVVDWHACLDPAAYHIEVRSSHCGMAVNGEVFGVIGRTLRPERVVVHPRSSVQAVTSARALAA